MGALRAMAVVGVLLAASAAGCSPRAAEPVPRVSRPPSSAPAPERTTTSRPFASSIPGRPFDRAANETETARLAATARAAVLAVARVNGRSAPTRVSATAVRVEAAVPRDLARATITVVADGRRYDLVADAVTGEILTYRDGDAYRRPAVARSGTAAPSRSLAIDRIEALFPGRGKELEPFEPGAARPVKWPAESSFVRVVDGVPTDDFVNIGLDARGDVVYYGQNWRVDPARVRSVKSHALPAAEVIAICARGAGVETSSLTATLRYRSGWILSPDKTRGLGERFVEGLLYDVEGPWSAAVDAGTGEVLQRTFHD